MIRMFEQHRHRRQRELEGFWDFSKVTSKTIPQKYEKKLFVPGCWENEPNLITYRGYGVYRKIIEVETKSNLRLIFKGVSHTADVYFDGIKIGHHYNAFTEFSIILPSVVKGIHELVVIADNSFSEASALHVPNDYYCYGGIVRPVVLEEIEDVYIKNIRFTPKYQDGVWYADIEVCLENISDIHRSINLDLYLDDELISKRLTVDIEPRAQAAFTLTNKFEKVQAWEQAFPKLYRLKANVLDGELVIDDFIERVGFREIKVKGSKLFLNGHQIFIKGFNRHEDHMGFGCALPTQLAANDLAMVKDMHANSIRTSHYPNDERFLDMCDELGIFVWEENHARGLTLEQMQNPNFEKQCEDCIDEMIFSHYNHPSIIIWGILNECASDEPKGRAMYAKQFAQIKSLDKSRPLTFATCRHFTDICLDLVDIVSVNLYFGWYGQEESAEEIEKSYLEELAWIQKAGGAGKPLIISEFGAGAFWGYHTPTNSKWSEERQAQILDRTLSVYLKRPEIAGTYIWQFSDCRITEGKMATSRPRTMNNKGIVDEYRRPKMAYATVKEHYSNHSG